MQIEQLLTKTYALTEADIAAAAGHFRYAARRGSIVLLAVVLFAAGLTGSEISLYHLVELRLGAGQATGFIALFNLVSAACAFFYAARLAPVPELAARIEQRRQARAGIQQALTTDAPSSVMRPLIETLFSALLLPLLVAVLRDRRSRQEARRLGVDRRQ